MKTSFYMGAENKQLKMGKCQFLRLKNNIFDLELFHSTADSK